MIAEKQTEIRGSATESLVDENQKISVTASSESDILQRIACAVTSYKMQFGHDPEAILIGAQDWFELYAVMAKFNQFPDGRMAEPKMANVNGIKILIVAKTKFLSVAVSERDAIHFAANDRRASLVPEHKEIQ